MNDFLGPRLVKLLIMTFILPLAIFLTFLIIMSGVGVYGYFIDSCGALTACVFTSTAGLWTAPIFKLLLFAWLANLGYTLARIFWTFWHKND